MLERFGVTHFPLYISITLCQQNEIHGSSITMAVPERCFNLRDGRSIKSLGSVIMLRGLSASTFQLFKIEWANEYQYWQVIPIDEDRWFYIYADRICSGLRSEIDKLCVLLSFESMREAKNYFNNRR